MTATIAERVAAGAAFLDTRDSGWWQRIDLEHLDLGDGCRCILGQLLDDYISVEYVHFRHARHAYGLGYPETTDLGFDADPDGPDDEFEQLTAAWAALIASRRSNDKTPVGDQ
ncbi:MAG TPA: hypothetical protein VGS19_29040 [Streptosporangiaceae bacterium]|nr:hypothetical protein [Streptosporangiaceae bacterium]